MINGTHDSSNAEAHMATQTKPGYRRLFRSKTDRLIAGVCGGVAAYLDIHSAYVRLGWILLTLAGGLGLWLYLAAVLFVPRSEDKKTASSVPRGRPGTLAGFGLIGLGLLILTARLHDTPWFEFPFGVFRRPWLPVSFGTALAVMLIVLGVVSLVRWHRGDGIGPESVSEKRTAGPKNPPNRAFHRSGRSRIIAGVCGGLGETLAVDPVLVRLAFVLFLIFPIGVNFLLGLVLYAVLAILLPVNGSETPSGRARE
jgi:phage shock protein C